MHTTRTLHAHKTTQIYAYHKESTMHARLRSFVQEAAALKLQSRNEFLEACDKELQRVEEFFRATHTDLLSKSSKACFHVVPQTALQL